MKTRNLKIRWALLAAIIFVGLLCSIQTLLAQTNAAAGGDAGTAPLPTTTAGFWTLAIAGVTPLIVGAINWLVPKIPSVVLPSVTPFIGIALGWVLNKLGATHFAFLDMAQAGALAVFVREVFNQAVTKRLAGPAPATPGT